MEKSGNPLESKKTATDDQVRLKKRLAEMEFLCRGLNWSFYLLNNLGCKGQDGLSYCNCRACHAAEFADSLDRTQTSCKLIQRFRDYCRQWGAPIPSPEFDPLVPKRLDGVYSWEWDAGISTPKGWIAEVIALPFDKAIARVYRMLWTFDDTHTWEKPEAEKQSFEAWFASRLPTDFGQTDVVPLSLTVPGSQSN